MLYFFCYWPAAARKQPDHGNAADIQLAPATGHVGKVGENRVSLVEDTVSQQGLMTRFILSLSGKKEEAIRDMPNIIGKALNSPEMQAITGDAVVVALDRISGRRIKWLIGCNEQTIYWISGRSTRQRVYAGGRYPAGHRAGGGLEVLRAVSKCLAGRIRRAHPRVPL